MISMHFEAAPRRLRRPTTDLDAWAEPCLRPACSSKSKTFFAGAIMRPVLRCSRGPPSVEDGSGSSSNRPTGRHALGVHGAAIYTEVRCTPDLFCGRLAYCAARHSSLTKDRHERAGEDAHGRGTTCARAAGWQCARQAFIANQP